jgi:hypothetical protein
MGEGGEPRGPVAVGREWPVLPDKCFSRVVARGVAVGLMHELYQLTSLRL